MGDQPSLWESVLPPEVLRLPRIDMSDFDRSQADGSIVNASTIKVEFPDDATYTGTVQTPNKITWSNASSWTKL